METRAQKRIRLEQEEQEEQEQYKKTKEEVEDLVNEIKMHDPAIISELEDISKNLHYESDSDTNKSSKVLEIKYGSICTIM